MNSYVITIARGFGSGGKEIAHKLSEKLAIPCYEKQILTMASERSGINEILFNQADEKLRGNYITNILKKIPASILVEAADRDFVSDKQLFDIQAAIIKQLAKSKSCIIIGKCADDLLREHKNVISVYVEAPRESCVASIMNKMQVTEEKAHDLINKTDRYRAEYYRFYTQGKDWTNPINYDLTLNSERIGRDSCVQIIESYVQNKFADLISLS